MHITEEQLNMIWIIYHRVILVQPVTCGKKLDPQIYFGINLLQDMPWFLELN